MFSLITHGGWLLLKSGWFQNNGPVGVGLLFLVIGCDLLFLDLLEKCFRTNVSF